jgi:hypothetical protein
MYRQFFIQQFYVLPTMHLCVCVDFRKKTIISLYSINLFDFKTEAECLLRGTNWVFKSDRYSIVLQRFIYVSEIAVIYTQKSVSFH